MDSTTPGDRLRQTILAAADLDAIFGAAPDPYLVVLPNDPTYTIAAVNRTYAQATSTTPEEIVGRGFFEIFPDAAPTLRASLRRVLDTKIRDTAMPAADGQHSRIAVNSPVLDDTGNVSYIIHRLEATLEKNPAEEMLRQNEGRYRRLFEAMEGGFCIIEKLNTGPGQPLDFRCLEANSAFTAHASVDAVVGRTMREALPGEWEECFLTCDAVVQTGKPSRIERGLLEHGRVLELYAFRIDDDTQRRVAILSKDITERKRAEDAWRKSEERLRLALDASGGLGTWDWDVAADRLYTDAQFAELFSVDPERARAGAPLAEFLNSIHPDDRSRVSEEVQKTIATGEDYSAEYRVKRPDGSVRWVHARGRCYRDEAGNPARFPGVLFDISQRKKAEEHLLQQWRTFDTVLSNISDFAYTFDQEGRFIYVNRALLALWQKPLDEALGKTPLELNYPAELDARLRSQVKHVIATKTPLRDRTPYTDPSGKRRYYEYIFVPVFSEDGSVEAVTGSTRDTTERDQMEAALLASEEQLLQVFAQAPVAVAVLRGSEMIFELVNPTYQRFFPGRELLGRPLLDVVPELDQAIRAILHGVLDTGQPFIGHEYRIPLARGDDGVLEDCWFTFVYQPLRNLDGTIRGLIVVAVDVTAQVLARKEMERVNRELEEFAYVASHDMQEPLRMVNIYTQLLLRRFGDDRPQAKRFAEFIRQGVTRMEALIRDLLSFSRTVHTEGLPSSTTADLTDALTEARVILKQSIDESAATIQSPTLPIVRGDTSQMAHVFQNLLSNSVKYRKKDTALRIQISAKRDGENWIVAVRDNGIGFEPQYAERIFGLFKRLHKDEYPGTGLGLAICQRIVERYGGRMWAESTLGEGAVFYFSLAAVGGA